MKRLSNSLYITTDGTYIHKDRETIVIEQNRKKVFQLPFDALGGIFCFGQVMVSPALMASCGTRGIELAFFTEHGKFQARVLGQQSGNVLLRRSQYRFADDSQYRFADESPTQLARIFIGAKIANTRQILLRQVRNYGHNESLETCAVQLSVALKRLQYATNLDEIRGIEGESGAKYFSVFNSFISPEQRSSFQFNGRNRRPPLDPVNALLSFCYSLLTSEIASALQGVGLDPYVGFLHSDRPGRLSLALDMVEEFRAWWCDRFVLTLINRKQVKKSGFVKEASGAMRMKDETRKTVLSAWQEKKQEQLIHPYLGEKIQIGLLPHAQSALLAKFLRNDLEVYTPFYTR